MRCTVLADDVAVGVVTLTFTVSELYEPGSVLGSGPIEPLAAFDVVLGAFVPRASGPLVPFRSSGQPSPPLWTQPGPWPTFALQNARGAILPARTVRCLPTRRSPSGLVIVAVFDEATAPVGAWMELPLREPGEHHDHGP